MKISLRAKITVFVTLVILIISVVSTYLFVSQHKRHIENEFIARGATLSYLLSKIAREGIETEKVDLIEKAAFIIQAEDVTTVHVYTDLWDLIESYPENAMHKDPSIEDAIKHFNSYSATRGSGISDDSFYIKRRSEYYCFFHIVTFQPYEKAVPITIGYVMVDMSTQHLQKNIKQMIRSNIIAALFITIITVLALNILIGRIIGKPIMDIHNSVRNFREGAVSEIKTSHSSDEIGDLAREFNEMSRTIKEKENMLIESERNIAYLFNRVEHAIFRLDKEGNIIKTNHKFNEIFGEKVKRLCDIIMSENRVRDYFENEDFANRVKVEEKVIGRNGGELIVLLSLYPDTGHDGHLNGFDGYMLDITERKRAEENIRLAAKVMESALEGIFITDSEFNITAVNPSFNDITGLSYDEVKGRNPSIMAAGDYDIETYRQVLNTIKTGMPWQGEIRNRHKKGEAYIMWLNISSIKGNDGDITNYVGVFTDITQRKLTEDHLKFRANYDILTGLPNKALFKELLGHSMEHAKRDKKKLVVMFLDIDNFKLVNDNFGHAVGDLLLQDAAQRLRECIRQSDIVSRLSGDEFAIILGQIGDVSNAVFIAQKILLDCNHPFYPAGNEIIIGISIGISVYPENGTDADTLLKNADAAMYLAKNSGKNSYRLFSEKTDINSGMIK